MLLFWHGYTAMNLGASLAIVGVMAAMRLWFDSYKPR